MMHGVEKHFLYVCVCVWDSPSLAYMGHKLPCAMHIITLISVGYLIHVPTPPAMHKVAGSSPYPMY